MKDKIWISISLFSYFVMALLMTDHGPIDIYRAVGAASMMTAAIAVGFRVMYERGKARGAYEFHIAWKEQVFELSRERRHGDKALLELSDAVVYPTGELRTKRRELDESLN